MNYSCLLHGSYFLLAIPPGNAQSWLHYWGRVRIQPLEFTKLTIIVYLSAVLANKQEYINDLKRAIIPPILIVFLFVS